MTIIKVAGASALAGAVGGYLLCLARHKLAAAAAAKQAQLQAAVKTGIGEAAKAVDGAAAQVQKSL